VNVMTSVGATGSKTFKVTLKRGKYSFVCDPHASSMRGSFTIKKCGAAPAVPRNRWRPASRRTRRCGPCR
jgi:hypothetical protein